MRPILAKDWLKISDWEGRDENCSQLFLLASNPFLLRQQLAGVLSVTVEHVPDQVERGGLGSGLVSGSGSGSGSGPDQVEGGEDGGRGWLLRPGQL